MFFANGRLSDYVFFPLVLLNSLSLMRLVSVRAFYGLEHMFNFKKDARMALALGFSGSRF